MNAFIMCIIKCVSARRNLYSPVKFAAHLYVFLTYTKTARMIKRLFVHELIRLDRNHPSLRFLRRFSFYFTIDFNKYIYSKKTIAILRQPRGVLELGRVSICPTTSINSLVRICETPSSRLIQIRNTLDLKIKTIEQFKNVIYLEISN